MASVPTSGSAAATAARLGCPSDRPAERVAMAASGSASWPYIIDGIAPDDRLRRHRTGSARPVNIAAPDRLGDRLRLPLGQVIVRW